MTSSESIRQAGDYLATEFLAHRPLDVMIQPFAPTDEQQGYAIQEAFLGRVAEEKGTEVWGYKIAYTNAFMRDRAGVAGPCSGLILASGVHESGVTLNRDDYLRLGIECEVAVRMGADLPPSGAPYTRETVHDAIEWLAASFEIIDGRDGAAGEAKSPALRSIVTNINNGGAVLAEPVTDWQSIDLAASQGKMIVNGEVIGEGVGTDIMGHPLEPVAWLANNLVGLGKSLKAGDMILTGSFAPPYFIEAGDSASISIEGLGEAHFTVAG
ncbi:MAG: fumarylacetoacetate hydrolase family protein [Dehalococcoidia bacterium]|nr:fumarylacetoacetate hydrolase family protein [Dehalococcoidia bacterium]